MTEALIIIAPSMHMVLLPHPGVSLSTALVWTLTDPSAVLIKCQKHVGYTMYTVHNIMLYMQIKASVSHRHYNRRTALDPTTGTQ